MITNSPNSRIGLHLLVWPLIVLLGACSRDRSPTAPSGPPAAGSAVEYTAIGASDATGHGGSIECDIPFQTLQTCPNGTGYVYVTARQLQSQGLVVTLRNMGIPTAVISRTFQTLGQQYNHLTLGNLIEQEMPFVLPNSTIVTIFAGGNEINIITGALGGGAGAGDQTGFIDAQVRQFGADYATLVAGIRARAGASRIIALNVPNLAGLPFLATASLGQKQAAQRAAAGMNTTVVNPLTAQGIVVVDLACDPRTYMPSNYSPDGFHPNDAGYAFMASEVIRAVTLSTYPAPRGSCSQMALF